MYVGCPRARTTSRPSLRMLEGPDHEMVSRALSPALYDT
jgi:hypothetical protein